MWARRDAYVPTRVAYGNLDNLLLIALVYLGVLIGMVSQYFYGITESQTFSLRSFLRPLFVSPLVLLPLVDILQKVQTTTAIEYVSMTILGFQNGFFWQTVLKDAAKKKEGQ